MKSFALFFLRKVFWDFYDHLFVILFLNFLYTLPLIIFYALLLTFFNYADLFFLVLALFYGAVISPLFMPLVGFLQKVACLKTPSLAEFWPLFRDIPWKRCWLIHLLFLLIGIVYFFNVWFYLMLLRQIPFLIALLILFFFLGLILMAWHGLCLVHFYNKNFSFRRLRTLAAITIEYWTFLFPWMITWIILAVLSYLIVLPLVVFFPGIYILFMVTFVLLIEKNYEIKEDVYKDVRTRRELIRRYHHVLKEYYERYADEDGHYKRSLRDIFRPWRH